jgi:predicted DCC family thiol-disulfide oxidoreductase YuxK
MALNRLRRWFGAPVPATSIGVLRLVAVGCGLLGLARLGASMHGALDLPDAFHPQPALLPFAWPPSAAWQPWIMAAAWITGIAALVGLGTRIALALFLGLLSYLAIGDESTGLFDHEILVPLHALAVLIVCPGADALSLDRRLRRAPSPTLVAGWGLRVMLMVFALVYFTAGVSKLRFSDGQWWDGQTLARYYEGASRDLQRQYFAAVDAPRPEQVWRDGVGLEHHLYTCGGRAVNYRLSQQGWLMTGMSIVGIILELSAPLLLLRGRWRNLYIAGVLGFHNSNGQLMTLPFWHYQFVLLCLIDWRDVGRLCAGRWNAPTAAPPIVLFDGVCGLCDRTVDLVLAHDPHGRFRFAALQSPAGARLLAQHGLPADYLNSFALVVDDRVLLASDAAIAIAARLGGPWRLLCVLRCVPRPLRDLGYRLIARVRYRVFGRRPTCRLPTPAERARFLEE